MKIFVVEPYTRSSGHFERLAARTCEAFAHLHHDVTLVTYGGISKIYPEETLPFDVVAAEPASGKDFNPSYHKGKIDTHRYRIFLKKVWIELRTFRLAVSLIRRERRCIVHFYDAEPVILALAMSLPLRSVRKPTGAAVLLTVHETSLLYPPQVVKLRRIVYRWLYRRCLESLLNHKLDGIVVLDPSLKEELLTHLKISPATADRIRVLPHGVGDPFEIPKKEDSCLRLGLDPRDVIFLIFGILAKYKRIDLAIEAIKNLPRCRLLIAGGEDHFTADMVQEIIRAHRCERTVSTEIDYIPEQKMHDYFSACDAVILPYDQSFKRWSGILTLACGHGKAVIASDVGIVGETVKEHKLGFVVEPDNATKLREAILRFLALTPEEHSQMEQRIKSYANLQNWDAVCSHWVDFYHTLLERQK